MGHEVRETSYSEHFYASQKLRFETTAVSEPLQTITATLLVSKWSLLPLRLVLWLSICTLKTEVRVRVGNVRVAFEWSDQESGKTNDSRCFSGR